MALTRTFRALLSCASWKRGMSVGRRSTGRRREEKEPPRPSEIGKDGVHLRHIVDLTGGKLLPNQEQNARLSEDVKDAMVQMQREDPERWNVEALAKHFAIRRERVLAILALARMEREMLDQGKQIFPELREIARKAYGPGYAKGNGERHIAFVPTYPRYKLVSPEEVEDVQTPSYEELVQKRSREEEDVLVQEFKERLDFNTGVTGKGLSRQSRFINAPRRPKEGWSLMIKPLGKNAPAEYVGLPDGTQREPNEDELLFIRQKMPRLRRRIE